MREFFITLKLIIIPLLVITSCNHFGKDNKQETVSASITAEKGATGDFPDSAFVNLKKLSNDFVYDMRYATDNNFLNTKVYDCDNCLVRYEVAKALIEVSKALSSNNLKIKFFDCFRPVEVQKKMWKIMPDDRYVANPYTTGSVHNKGAAVDITLVDKAGRELDMGTEFDHFDKEAHHNYTNLPDTVIQNRRLLKSIMESAGFDAIRTEWWHYNYRGRGKYRISDQQLCE